MTVLKVLMVIYGIVRIVFGAFVLLSPGQFIDVTGFGTYIAAAGFSWIAIGAWAIYAVGDLVRNIIYVKFLITLELVTAAGIGYTAVAGYLAFGDMVLPFVMACVFATLLLIFYPWRAGREKAGEQ